MLLPFFSEDKIEEGIAWKMYDFELKREQSGWRSREMKDCFSHPIHTETVRESEMHSRNEQEIQHFKGMMMKEMREKGLEEDLKSLSCSL